MPVQKWEYIPESSSKSKSYAEFNERPNPQTGAYGDTVLYDTNRPVKVITIKARGMSIAESNAEEAKMDTPGATYSYTLRDNRVVTGVVVSHQASLVNVGSHDLEVTLQIRLTQNTVINP